VKSISLSNRTNDIKVQTFKNPHGAEFDVMTVRNCNVAVGHQAFPEATWFPGYHWRLAVCPKCGRHLGWFYESDERLTIHPALSQGQGRNQEKLDSFVGLIVDDQIAIRAETTWSTTALIAPAAEAVDSHLNINSSVPTNSW